MINYIFHLRLISLTPVTLILMTSATVFCQSKIQKRIIIEDEQNHSLVEVPNSKYHVIKEDKENNESTFFYSPVSNFTILNSNPIPWYKRNDIFYYVSFDSAFKGNYSLRIQVVELDKLRSIKNYDLKAIMENESNPINKFFLSEMHNRRFNKDDLKNLYYDFTVQKDGTVILVSYYQNTVCAYQSTTNMQKLDFCGCTSLTLTTPFQVFENDGDLLIKGFANNYHSLNIDTKGSIEVLKLENRSSIKLKDDYLIIYND